MNISYTRWAARLVFLALGSGWMAHAAAPGDPVRASGAFLFDGNFDGPALAYELRRTFLSEAKWKEQVGSMQSRYQDWEKENKGDMGQFLNDQLVSVALGAAGGEVEKIQKGVAWLALYKEFKQEAHPLVLKFMREHRGSVTRLLTNFNWEKATLYVKNREWRRDIEERKAKLAQAGRQAGASNPAGGPATQAAAPVKVPAAPAPPNPGSAPVSRPALADCSKPAAPPAKTLVANASSAAGISSSTWMRYSWPAPEAALDLIRTPPAEIPLSDE